MGINMQTLCMLGPLHCHSDPVLSSTLVEGTFMHSYATLNPLVFSIDIHLPLNIVASKGLGRKHGLYFYY